MRSSGVSHLAAYALDTCRSPRQEAAGTSHAAPTHPFSIVQSVIAEAARLRQWWWNGKVGGGNLSGVRRRNRPRIGDMNFSVFAIGPREPDKGVSQGVLFEAITSSAILSILPRSHLCEGSFLLLLCQDI